MTQDPPEAKALAASTYEAHASRLMALAAALVGPSNAEDVVADAVLRAMNSHGWSQVQNHGAYLTRAVVNEAKASYRSAMRREARERRFAASRTVAHDPDPVPELLAALAALPMQQRAVTFLTYWSDLTPAGVADELGIAEGTVRKHLARARANLRTELQ